MDRQTHERVEELRMHCRALKAKQRQHEREIQSLVDSGHSGGVAPFTGKPRGSADTVAAQQEPRTTRIPLDGTELI